MSLPGVFAWRGAAGDVHAFCANEPFDLGVPGLGIARARVNW